MFKLLLFKNILVNSLFKKKTLLLPYMFFSKPALLLPIVPSIFPKVFYSFHIPRQVIQYPSIGRKTYIKKMSEGRTNKNANKNNFKNSSKSRFPPSEMYLCVLGNGSSSSSRALYMFTDHEKYLFNCGEGTQRLATEHKMKLSKLNHVFITHKSWDNLGGLLGLSLTLQGMGVPRVMIHGPPGIISLYEHTRTFIYLQDLHIDTKSTSKSTDKPFTDDCMEVQYIPIFKSSSTSETMKNREDFDESSSVEPRSKKLRLSKDESTSDVTIAFACKGHSKPGRILLDKCVDFGVPVGPLLGDLKNGKDVTLPSGKVVLSKDVVSEEEVCPLFLVVECPSEEFLDPFLSEEKFRPHQENGSAVASLVVHFTPPEVLNSSKYLEWMKKFSKTTSHLILNSDCATLNSLAIHRIQHQLNLLHPGMFTLLQENEHRGSATADNVFHADTLERYYLRPPKELDRSFALKLEPDGFIEEAVKSDEFNQHLKELQVNIKQKSISKDELYPEVAFLGTGSSIPNKARNVSAILVNTSENRCILMDCGEGTYGQLLRLYRDQYKDKLLNLFCIFISHMHADHHLGLIKILKARQEIFKKSQKKYEPVFLVGPSKLDPWLKNYYSSFESTYPLYRFTECSCLKDSNLLPKSETNQEIEICEDILISTVPVRHCPDAHGAIISSKSSKWKLVYSGDTRPCEDLITAGQDCSLLIHEATMEDDLLADAKIKKHSTTSEAIEVSDRMKAQYTILTHFSQRYAKVPLFNDDFYRLHKRVGCAFDNMTVRPSELYILHLLIPALNILFAESVKDLHTKGDKRRKKAELMKTMLEDSISTETNCTNKA